MRVILLVTALALGASAATAASTGTVTHDSVQVDGQTRTYRIFVPARPKKPARRSCSSSTAASARERVASQTGFDAEAEKRGFVAVYPDGLGRAWNAGPCCGASSRLGVDDVGFGGCSTDSDGSTGSTGSGSTPPASRTAASSPYRLACELSGRIAAAAPCRGRSSRVSPLRVPSRSSTCTGWKTRTSRSRADRTRRMWSRVAGGPGRHRALAHAGRLSRDGQDHGQRCCHRSSWAPPARHRGPTGDDRRPWPREKAPYNATPEIWRFFAAHRSAAVELAGYEVEAAPIGARRFTFRRFLRASGSGGGSNVEANWISRPGRRVGDIRGRVFGGRRTATPRAT